jgi:hypothetical protein
LLTRFVVCVSVVLIGCGGTLADPPTADLGLARAWKGQMFVGTAPFDPFPTAYDSDLHVSVSDYAVRVAGVCPDGTGTIVATGSGPKAEWSGALQCAPARVGQCAADVLTMHHIVFTLNGDTLEADGQGVASGCGVDREILFAYSGGPNTAPPRAPLSRALAGQWVGDLIVTPQGGTATTIPSRLMRITTTSNAALIVGGLCPGAAGELLLADGDGDSLQWFGTMLCGATITLGSCPDTFLRYGGVRLTLQPDGTMRVDAQGETSGCSSAVPAAATMTMTR